ncbi:hypothetical protein ACIGD1_11425 [Streptomyces sp. NPDC085612]|uniref:hypothetical protein n=1 Tax=Streptomyces sp. NPDC085612 TaxID=3365732 RepID=UPI0037D7CD31
MRIRHSRLTRDFLQVPNATVRDARMSHMARGILVELLSRPDEWKATADDMWQASVAKHGKASPGRRQFRAAFAELKEHGYLTANRELIGGGQHATVLTLSDVPQGGTSARPADSGKTAGHTDVPHAGTSEGATDVPASGTSGPPAKTGDVAGRSDVPLSDVPHAGTSKEEDEKKKTGKNTSSTAAPADRTEDEHLAAFGAFWINFPKKLDRAKAKTEWVAAIRRGADPAHMVEAAQAYAREKAGAEPRFVSYPANWLKNERYFDEYPTPDLRPALRALPAAAPSPAVARRNASRDYLDELSAQLRAGGAQ